MCHSRFLNGNGIVKEFSAVRLEAGLCFNSRLTQLFHGGLPSIVPPVGGTLAVRGDRLFCHESLGETSTILLDPWRSNWGEGHESSNLVRARFAVWAEGPA